MGSLQVRDPQRAWCLRPAKSPSPYTQWPALSPPVPPPVTYRAPQSSPPSPFPVSEHTLLGCYLAQAPPMQMGRLRSGEAERTRSHCTQLTRLGLGPTSPRMTQGLACRLAQRLPPSLRTSPAPSPDFQEPQFLSDCRLRWLGPGPPPPCRQMHGHYVMIR